MLAGDTDDSVSVATESGKKEVDKNTAAPNRKNKVCKLQQMPIHHQSWRVRLSVRRLVISDGSSHVQASAVFYVLQMEQVLEGSLCQAL